MAEKWEYQDFVWSWSQKNRPRYRIDDAHNKAHAALTIWQEYQSSILPDLQKWLDRGWEPITEVGPASIQFMEHQGFVSWIDGLVIAILSIPLLFVPFIYLWATNYYIDPVEFRVKMRRHKSRFNSGSPIVGRRPI